MDMIKGRPNQRGRINTDRRTKSIRTELKQNRHSRFSSDFSPWLLLKIDVWKSRTRDRHRRRKVANSWRSSTSESRELVTVISIWKSWPSSMSGSRELVTVTDVWKSRTRDRHRVLPFFCARQSVSMPVTCQMSQNLWRQRHNHLKWSTGSPASYIMHQQSIYLSTVRSRIICWWSVALRPQKP